MRRIDKTCSLSTAYKTWHDECEANGLPHPKYTSSSHRFYWDVVMNLLHCQGGLCAYTEIALCDPALFHPTNWQNGQYVAATAGKPQTNGQLEHFDGNLKEVRGWLWDNFFMVDTDVNTKVKSVHAVDQILKPDAPDYNPFGKLEYDAATHMFIPRTDLPEDIKARIKNMLITLGINFGPVTTQRRIYLTPILKAIKFGIDSWESANVEQFPTAFEMIKRACS
jgi:hypothetical protein